jgi:hypothetical protein
MSLGPWERATPKNAHRVAEIKSRSWRTESPDGLGWGPQGRGSAPKATA